MQDPDTQTAYWPGGGLHDGDATVFLANGPDGSLMLVRAGPVEGRTLHWRALATLGGRDLRTARGHLLMLPAGDSLAALARTLPVAQGNERATVHAFDDDVARWEADPTAPAAPAWAYFREQAGPATFEVLAGFDGVGFLAPFDGIHGRESVDAALVLDPVVADVLDATGLPPDAPCIGILLDTSVPRRARAAAAAEALGLPSDAAAAMARLMALWAGRRFPARITDVMAAWQAVPVDWVPSGAGDMAAMGRVSALAAAVHGTARGALDLGVLLAPVRGRWAEYLRTVTRLLPSGDAEPDAVASDVADGVAAFREDVVDPIRALARERLGKDPEGSAAAMAWRALHGGRGLAAVLEGSRDWHARAGAIRETVAAACGDLRVGWPEPFGSFTASNGLLVEPLRDVDDLSEAGRLMSNCVATYVPRCAKGEVAMAWIGPADGSPRGSSVACLTTSGGKVKVDQHKGHANTDASPQCAAALAEAVAAIEAAGGLVLAPKPQEGTAFARVFGSAMPPRLAHLAYDPRPDGAVGRAVSAWSRHLRHDLRAPLSVLALGDPDAAAALRDAGPGSRPPSGAGIAFRRVAALMRTNGAEVVLGLALLVGACGPLVLLIALAAFLESTLLGSDHAWNVLALAFGSATGDRIFLAVIMIMLGALMILLLAVKVHGSQSSRIAGALEAAATARRRAREEVGAVADPA